MSIEEAPTPIFSFLDEQGEPAAAMFTFDTMNGFVQASSVEVEPEGDYSYVALPAGTYTLNEQVEGDWNLSMSVNGVEDDDLTFTGRSGDFIMLTAGNERVNFHFYTQENNFGDADSLAGIINEVNNVRSAGDNSLATIRKTEGTGISIMGNIMLPENSIFEINSEEDISFVGPSGGSSLTVPEGSKIILNDNAKINVPQYYHWRDNNGIRLDIDDETNEITGPATLSYGCDLKKDGAKITFDNDSTVYNSEEQKPTVIVTYDGENLIGGQDYDIEYEGDFIKATTHTVKVIGKNAYQGTLEKEFSIKPAPLTIKNISVADKLYDGSVAAEIENYGQLEGIIVGNGDELDDVSLNTGSVSAEFADSIVGKDKNVTLSGYAIEGAAAGNYVLSDPSSLTASITASGDEETDRKVEDVMRRMTPENVQPEDEEVLEEVKGILEDIIDEGSLTDEQNEAFEKEIDRIDEMLDVINETKEEGTDENENSNNNNNSNGDDSDTGVNNTDDNSIDNRSIDNDNIGNGNTESSNNKKRMNRRCHMTMNSLTAT